MLAIPKFQLGKASGSAAGNKSQLRFKGEDAAIPKSLGFSGNLQPQTPRNSRVPRPGTKPSQRSAFIPFFGRFSRQEEKSEQGQEKGWEYGWKRVGNMAGKGHPGWKIWIFQGRDTKEFVQFHSSPCRIPRGWIFRDIDPRIFGMSGTACSLWMNGKEARPLRLRGR